MPDFSSSGGATLRRVAPADVPALHALILELADFEQLADEVVATEESTHAALFGPAPCAEAVLAEDAGVPVGFALYYPVYSTFAGRSGLFLEDLFVKPCHRRAGVGRALMEAFITTARERGCPKVEWRVLTWNDGAIQFYESLGATVLRDWVPVRLGLATSAATA